MAASQYDAPATLIIRPARAADRDAVIAFCRRIWEGNDYVNEEVFDAWLIDVPGPMLVAELTGQPVAMGKVAVHSDGHAWFQGLRVDPAMQGQGIARRMHKACEQAAAAVGAAPWALLTADAGPTAVQRLCDAHGWAIQGRTRYLHLLPEPAGDTAAAAAGLITLGTDDLPILQATLLNSPTLAALGGWYTLDWECEPFTIDKLHAHLPAGQVWALPDRSAWGIVTVAPPDSDVQEEDKIVTFAPPDSDVQEEDDETNDAPVSTFTGGYAWWAFAEGKPPALEALAKAIHQATCRRQRMELALHVPVATPWDQACRRTNFWRDPDHAPKQFRLYVKSSP